MATKRPPMRQIRETKASSTSPSWSTARHRQWRSSLIFTNTSSRCHRQRDNGRIRSIRFLRISPAKMGPNRSWCRRRPEIVIMGHGASQD